MKDYLLDVVQHTHSLGFIDLVKITGDDSSTVIEGIAEDRSVILKGVFHSPVPEFMGTFGMPNLATLNTILRISEYENDAKISINTQERNDETVPVGIHFENASSDFQNDYRFMASEVVNDKLKSVSMKDVNWGVEFAPTVASTQRFKIDGDALKFMFGDASTHAGDFVFQHDVGGSISKGWSWPVDQVSKILSLSGDVKYSISDDGVSQISIDSGLGVYNYLLPAQSK
jgi:hypothetical protein